MKKKRCSAKSATRVLCPSCRRFVERGWRTCPFCQTQLKDVCTQCEELLSFNWVACPSAGRSGKAHRPAIAAVAAMASIEERVGESHQLRRGLDAGRRQLRLRTMAWTLPTRLLKSLSPSPDDAPLGRNAGDIHVGEQLLNPR